MREFSTAVAELEAEELDLEYPHEFKLDGVVCRFRNVTGGEFTMLMASYTRHSKTADKISAAIDLMVNVLDDESRAHIEGRLMDPKDPFDFRYVAGDDDIPGIIPMMIEEWEGNPTNGPSGSTPRPQRTGSGSKRSTRK